MILGHMNDKPPTAQVVHSLTHYAIGFLFREKRQNRWKIYNLGYIFANWAIGGRGKVFETI